MTQTSNAVLNPKETAEYLGISLPTLYKMIRQGLPAIRLGRQWRIPKEPLDQWLATHSLQQESEN